MGKGDMETTSFKERRKHKRMPYFKPVRYYFPAPHVENTKKIYSYGDCVDISKGGLGMITEQPLTGGDILFFLDTISIDKKTIKSAIVRWTRELEDNRYRVGLEFRR